jgi:poly-gamma-glutamate synthase PgsB/CapB
MTRRSVNSLNLRIMVNGTRGKSSVTEYIAAGLLNSRTDVMAKITGVTPTFIHNGIVQIIKRTGTARMQEQIKIIRLAEKKKVNSLVLECMSVSPDLQKLESTVFKPHIYVITNIKDDHREHMGRSVGEQAESICNAIPENCIVITGEKQFLKKIAETAQLRKSRVISLQDPEPEVSDNLPDGIFSENIQLAIAACEAAGIDRKLAHEGIIKRALKSKSDLTLLKHENKEISFLNAFAVNDVDSTDNFLHYWRKKLGYAGKISVIFNTRADRPLRTDLLAGWIAGLPLVEKIIITGDHVNRASYSLRKAGTDGRNVFIWQRKQINNFKANLFNLVPDGSLVVGVGNINGDGFFILNKLI